MKAADLRAIALTPDRLADLGLLAIGATRRPDGRPLDVARGRIAWFARHGYIEVRPAPPRSTPAERRACVTVTERGCQAIAEDDARLDGVLVAPVPPERWPYGPPSHHEDCCRLHDRGLYCDCKASDASDAEYGDGHGPPIGAKP